MFAAGAKNGYLVSRALLYLSWKTGTKGYPARISANLLNAAGRRCPVSATEGLYMAKRQEKTRSRRPYRKPQLRTIDLATEEVLASGCKTASGATAVGNDGSCVTTVICYGEGS